MSQPWNGLLKPPVAVKRLAEIRLGKMLQPASGSSVDLEVPYLRAGSLAQIGELDSLPTMWAAPSEVARFSVHEGDLVVAEGGDVGRAAFVPPVSPNTIIQNSLHRVRPIDGNEVRYLKYCLESVYGTGWLDVLCNRSTFGHLTSEKLASLCVPSQPPSSQRAIADYLDAETARMDALIAKKRRMIELLDERKTLFFDTALQAHGFHWGSSLEYPAADRRLPTGWKVAHLSAMLEQLTNGYVGPTRDLLVDDGVKYIQSLHIKDGKIDFARGPYYVPADWHDARPRIHLCPGDVLIVQTGDIGQVAVVPPNFGPASCHALQIARVRRDVLLGDYLGAYLRSPFGRQSLLSRVTGALHPHLEGGIRDIPIVVAPVRVQCEIIEEIDERNAQLDSVRARLVRQIDLLVEHRQALITAAVTGELEIAGVAA